MRTSEHSRIQTLISHSSKKRANPLRTSPNALISYPNRGGPTAPDSGDLGERRLLVSVSECGWSEFRPGQSLTRSPTTSLSLDLRLWRQRTS